MSSSIGEQLSKCRELVANNPRPKFHTTNTTQDSRNRERLLNESESKKLFSPGLVDIKNSPRYYKDQVLHLKGLDPVKSEKYLCVLQRLESAVTTRTPGFHLLDVITETVRPIWRWGSQFCDEQLWTGYLLSPAPRIHTHWGRFWSWGVPTLPGNKLW